MTIPLGGLDAQAVPWPGPRLSIEPALANRNRLTTAFRLVLALPHLLLVGGPIAFGISIGWRAVDGPSLDWAAGTGLLGAVAGMSALISWVAILFTGTMPHGLWQLNAFYLRWRLRAIVYITLLRDEYPPFGDGSYPAAIELEEPAGPRNRVTATFRIFLLIPHFIALWLLSVLWLLTSIVAWFAILFTGAYPAALHDYAVSVLRWSLRVESYVLLLHDEYPPFTLEA